MVVASAAALAMSVAPAQAATGHVLTTGKTGGTAVKTNAVLKAGLVKGTSATFVNSLGTLKCKAGTLTTKVTANPAKPGTATESLTAQTFSKCTISVSGVTVKSLKVSNLPYKVTVSDKKGDPVKVSESSKSKPLKLTVTVVFAGSPITCTATAASIGGHASNTGNKVSFSKQKLASGGGGICPKGNGSFSASFGPLTDTSVKGSPKVFVN
jgi:hypothetical protein